MYETAEQGQVLPVRGAPHRLPRPVWWSRGTEMENRQKGTGSAIQLLTNAITPESQTDRRQTTQDKLDIRTTGNWGCLAGHSFTLMSGSPVLGC